MGLFGKVFGKEDKKDSCCCDMEIVEVPEGEEAPAAGQGARAIGDRGAPVGGSRYLTGCVLRLTAVTS